MRLSLSRIIALNDTHLQCISVEEVEREYWKLVIDNDSSGGASSASVEVRYGADLFTDSPDVGSGFCRARDTHIDARQRVRVLD